MREKEITTIIFDLAEVYLNGLLGVNLRLSEYLNKDIDYISFSVPERKDFFEGKISENDYLNVLINKNEWPLSITELKGIIRSNFTEIEGTRKIIEDLKKQGYRLGLLSVHGKEWIEYCEDKFDYHKLFDSVVYSFEIAARKPDKRTYLEILARLKVKPYECLFIDDRQGNLDAANALGIRTIHFTSSKQLKNDLAELGIKV